MNREEVNLSIRRQKPGLLSGAEQLAGYSLTARLESQEKASSEQLVRMGREASLTDRCTQLESQRDDARLEMMAEKETVAALRGEAEALQRQNQSLMAALSGNKQTGDQNA
jgi:hypothetical protein